MEASNSIYDYSDPVEFLHAYLRQAQKTNPAFSLRAWAKQMQLSNAALLSMVMNRKRRLLPSLSSKIREHFLRTAKFTKLEAQYFEALVLFSNAKTEDEKFFYQDMLSSMRDDNSFSTLQLDQLRFISDWYHFAIIEMTKIKGFNSDPAWIQVRLGNEVSLTEVTEAVDRLVRLGLLEKDESGQLRKSKQKLSTTSDIPSASIKKHHSQMIQKALKAMEIQSVNDRDITSHTIAIDTSKLPEAKKMIQNFRRRLGNFLASSESDTVYQLNIQLFNVLGETVNGGGEKHV